MGGTLGKRREKILRVLLQANDYIAIDDLARLVFKSRRTIYNDLKIIEKWLLDNFTTDVYIDKCHGLGIKVSGKCDLINLSTESSISNTEIYVCSPHERRQMIASDMLINQKIVTYQKLMDQYFVSSTSIKNDLQMIQQMYHTKLKSTKSGTFVEDNEINIRNSIFMLLDDALQRNNLTTNSSLKLNIPNCLRRFFNEKIVNLVVDEVFEIYEGECYYLPPQYIQSVIFNLLIFFQRMDMNFLLPTVDNLLFNQIQTFDIYYLAGELLEKLNKEFGVPYTKNDNELLAEQLISQGIKLNLAEGKNNVFEKEVQLLIKNVGEIFEIDFTRDEDLKNHLLLHFTPMIYRLKSGTTINNAMLEDIKRQYAMTFSTVKYAISEIEHDLQVTFNDDEIAYLTVYFQVAIEKMNIGKHILIVCPTGIGTSELILNRVKKILPEKDTIEVLAATSLKKVDLSQIDFIISSINIDSDTIPIVKVSPLLTTQDIKNILNLYSDSFYEIENTQEITLHLDVLGKMISKDMIYTYQSLHSKAEILDFLICELEEKGYVNEYFGEDVLKREQLGTTSLETGVAIPHASPENVKRTCLAVLTLNQSVQWNEYKVDVVILLCIAEKSRCNLKRLLSDIYSLVASKERMKFFFTGTSQEIVKKIRMEVN